MIENKKSNRTIGNVSNIFIYNTLGVPKQKLSQWEKKTGYENNLFWMLKSLNKKELLELYHKGISLKDKTEREKYKELFKDTKD